MKLEFKTFVREITREGDSVTLKCGKVDHFDNFEIQLSMKRKEYDEFLQTGDWPDPKQSLLIKLELEQVK